MQAEILRIMELIFGLEENQLKPDDAQADIEAWDSLVQMQLVIELENHFHVKFDFADLISRDSVIAIERIILEKSRLKENKNGCINC